MKRCEFTESQTMFAQKQAETGVAATEMSKARSLAIAAADCHHHGSIRTTLTNLITSIGGLAVPIGLKVLNGLVTIRFQS
jgi:hypothetical protein